MFIVIAQQKGGVGKTTIAANVAVFLARRGARVLVIDTDPQFALTRQLGLEVDSLGVNLVDVLAGLRGCGGCDRRGRTLARRRPRSAGARRRRDEPRRSWVASCSCATPWSPRSAAMSTSSSTLRRTSGS